MLAALSIPLNNKLSNFERLSFNYLPGSMNDFDHENPVARHELLTTAKMLNVDGYPSRSSVIHYINIENIHNNTSEHVSKLFDLIEQEESPFVISKKGKEALEALCTESPELAKYKPFIAKTLSVRILQKCKNFYRNMKMSKLQSTLRFYDSVTEIEKLLYECNREGLVHTTINYHSFNGEASMTFNAEAQVAENLFTFGNQLRQVFQSVVEATTHGKTQRQRIFMKVKEKLDEEVSEMQKQKEEMLAMQQQQAERLAKEKQDRVLEEQREAARKQRDLEDEKIRDEQRRARNTLLQALEKERKSKAMEILNALTIKGHANKKIGKDKIKELEKNPDRVDYDAVIEYYQAVLKKERE